MPTGHSVFQMDAPRSNEVAERRALDQELREGQAYRKAGGRIFPGQYYEQDGPEVGVRLVPPGTSTIGVLLPYDEVAWRVGPVPVPRGHQVAAYFNWTGHVAGGTNPCGVGPPTGGLGFGIGTRFKVKSEYAHPTINDAWASGYEVSPYAANAGTGVVVAPRSDYTIHAASAVTLGQLMTWQPNPAVTLGIEQRDVVPMRFWLAYAFTTSGDGIDRPNWTVDCLPKGTTQIKNLKLWVHVV